MLLTRHDGIWYADEDDTTAFRFPRGKYHRHWARHRRPGLGRRLAETLRACALAALGVTT